MARPVLRTPSMNRASVVTNTLLCLALAGTSAPACSSLVGAEGRLDPGSAGETADRDGLGCPTACPAPRVCLGNVCQDDPARGRETICPDGSPTASCEPVVDPCEAVSCGARETCVAGACVPGCFARTAECGGGGGTCSDGQHFDASTNRCVPTEPCDGRCPEGTVCHLSCMTERPGDGDCPAGTIRAGDACVEDSCAGVHCTGTSVCVNGDCVDSCDCGSRGCDAGECCVAGECVGAAADDGDGGASEIPWDRGDDCEGDCPVEGACGADDGCGNACRWGKCPDDADSCILGQCYCPGCSEDSDCGSDDGCGNACPIGKCDPGRVCIAGLCECDPDCPADARCGDSDGCGGTCAGDCGAGEECRWSFGGHECVCAPNCAASAACGGPDGCGGTCERGRCPDGERCDDGQCVCAPDCRDALCGAADGCGGTCGRGDCPAGHRCDGGECVPEGCEPACGCGQACVAGVCRDLCDPGQILCGCNTCCAAGASCVAGACSEGPE